jgi:hypothetical protein
MLTCKIPQFRGIRRHDLQDLREFFSEFGAALAEVTQRYGPQAARRVQIEVPGLINGPEPVHATSRVIEDSSGLINGPGGATPTFVTAPMSHASPQPQCEARTAGDSAHHTDPGCGPRQNCGEGALPFNSRGVSVFPVVGNGAFAEATLTVSPKVEKVTPYHIYWAAWDANNGYAPIRIAELVKAMVGTESQMLGSGMVASVFSDVKERIPVTWKSFSPLIPLELTFGHPLPNTVHMHVAGILWAEVVKN